MSAKIHKKNKLTKKIDIFLPSFCYFLSSGPSAAPVALVVGICQPVRVHLSQALPESAVSCGKNLDFLQPFCQDLCGVVAKKLSFCTIFLNFFRQNVFIPKIYCIFAQTSIISILNFRKLMEFRSYRSYRSSDNTSNPCKLTQKEPPALSSELLSLLNS